MNIDDIIKYDLSLISNRSVFEKAYNMKIKNIKNDYDKNVIDIYGYKTSNIQTINIDLTIIKSGITFNE